MSRVTVFGDINIDVILSIPDYPESGGDAMATRLVLRPGGSVANTAIVLAKLGVPVGMIGRTGDDRWAQMALQAMQACGVDLSAVSRDPEHGTGLIFIPVTPDGERTMFSYRGANTNVPVSQITAERLAGSQLLHLSAYNFLTEPQRSSTWHAVELAQEMGMDLTLDIGVEPARKASAEILRLLPTLYLVSLSTAEGQHLFQCASPEETAGRLLEMGVSVAVVKLGQHGCLIASQAEQRRLPTFSVESVDTTGAGDAFVAGLIYARLKGMNWMAGGLLANTLGALATTVWGSGPALPGRDEALRFLNSRIEVLAETGYQKALNEVLESLEGADGITGGR